MIWKRLWYSSFDTAFALLQVHCMDFAPFGQIKVNFAIELLVGFYAFAILVD